MCVAFHPTEPALIAGGTFSGEVRLWNTGIETDPLLASSGLSELGHKEPISKVSKLYINTGFSPGKIEGIMDGCGLGAVLIISNYNAAPCFKYNSLKANMLLGRLKHYKHS